MIIKALYDLNYALKGMINHKGNENADALVKMDELFSTEPKMQAKSKVVQVTDNVPSVMKYSQHSRVHLGQTANKASLAQQRLMVPLSRAAASSAIRTQIMLLQIE